jgi:hypothetical protein
METGSPKRLAQCKKMRLDSYTPSDPYFDAKMDVSTTKMCLDTSILASSNMNWRGYYLLAYSHIGVKI